MHTHTSPQFIHFHHPAPDDLSAPSEMPGSLVPPYIQDLPSAPQGPSGQSVLYLPHKLYLGPDALPANCHPLLTAPNIHFPHFPLQRPPGLLPSDIQSSLPAKLNPLKSSAYRTRPDAHTETAIAVDDLQNYDQTKLITVMACFSFWDNVCNYAGHNTYVRGPGLPNLNTWTSDRCIPVPLAEEQAKGVKALAGWYLSHVHRPPIIPAMTSEPSIQREVAIQMAEPLNALLQTRYTALTSPQPNLTARGVPQDKGFPQWTHHCQDLHLGPATSAAAPSGFPDFLLRCSDSRHHAVIGEVKTWWAYTDNKVFKGLFKSGAVNKSGHFVWLSTEISAKLLRQIWGQLYFFGCRLGFVTNGKVVMLVARTDWNTLILSVPTKWTDPKVLTALAGLSFAGVDMAYLDEEGCSTLTNAYLCPVNDRKPFWPPSSEES